jgi:AraC-like DNA-binding protein
MSPATDRRRGLDRGEIDRGQLGSGQFDPDPAGIDAADFDLDPAGIAPGAEQRAPEVFSTIGLPNARRVELWERHNSAALVRLDVRARSPLQASEVTVRLPRVTVARVRASSHAIERSAEAIAAEPYGAIAVYMMLRGESSFMQKSGSHTLRPGDAVICETDQPFARDFAHGLDELVVKVPCDALDIRSLNPIVASFGTQEGNQYADALAKLAARSTRAVQPVRADERTVLDLVAVLALGPQAERPVAYRAAARAFLEERLSDPGLGADQVAAAIGISERHLSRVFAADGTSVPRYVLSRRLELAHALLAAGQGSESVAEIAARCGFVSTTYFSHVFRRQFGRRAGEILRESRKPLEDW